MNVTTENVNTETGKTRFLLFICGVASLGGLLFGFDTAVISGTFGMVGQQFSLTKIQVGWFGSAALVGAIIGAIVAGSLSDHYGRKRSLVAAGVLFLISGLAAAVAPTFSILIAARVVGGAGIGLASVLSPMYISESSPPRLRGRLVVLYQLSIVLGILLAYLSNWLLLSAQQPINHLFIGLGFGQGIAASSVWRAMFGVGVLPAGLFILLLFFIPESPRWLISRGKTERGFNVLAKVNGRETAKSEFSAIKSALTRRKGTIGELLKPGIRLALIVGIGLSVFGQFSGVNIIIYYGPTILKDAGFGLGSALQFQIAIGLINFLFTCIGLYKIDDWGRRPLLIGGMSAVFASLMILTVMFSLDFTYGIGIVIMLCVYMARLALSINTVIWVLTGEIFPNRLRGIGMSIATFFNWGVNFLATFLFPWFVSRAGMNMGFLTFGLFCLIAVIFFYGLVPETKGKSLESIEAYWQKIGAA
jgi:SP family arabinose:H+ symporter-like MFS transporter